MEVPAKKSRIAFGSHLIDSNNKLMKMPILTKNNTYTGYISAGGYFEKDISFNVICLNNYKQVEFSLESETNTYTHTIHFKKNENQSYAFTKFKFKIENLSVGLNDIIIIFNRDFSNEELQYNFVNRKQIIPSYSLRICISNKDDKFTQDIYTDKNYEVIKNDDYALPDIFAINFSAKTNVKTKSTPQYDIIRSLLTHGNINNIPISINMRTIIDGSPYNNIYLRNEEQIKNEIIAVFSILNGELIPAFYNQDNKKEEFVHYYNKICKDIIVINPRVRIKSNGINIYSLFVVYSPYSHEYKDPDTYNYAKWSTVMTSNSVFIKVDSDIK